MPKEREDVEATLEQVTTPDASQQKKKWRAIDWIAGGTFIVEVLWGSWWLITQVCRLIPWNPHVSTEHFAQFYCGVGLGVLSVGYLTLILWPIIFNILKILKMKIFKNLKQGKDSKQDNDPRWFHARILSSGIVGGSYAFLLPVVMSLPEGNVNSGGAAALRQAILLATGGLIALIALGETRRKNDNDKLKNDQDKEKNDREHERWVKAERRERYAKAVEQLGDEKAPVRMGGVYTLVGLVDDWLEEESIEKYEDRLKEGQVIINNLCAYIRSPFTLASHYNKLSNPTPKGIYKDKKEKFYVDKAILDSEADVRLSIIKEIHDRLQGPEENTPGTWSDFEYDFSGSVFFYPVDLTKSYYKKPINFSGSTYQAWANFNGSTYQGGADFSGSTYQAWADFSRSTYQAWADFSGSTYEGEAYFNGSTYEGEAYFNGSTYQGEAYFNGSTYQGEAYFSRSTYQAWADFSRSTYQGEADFSGSIFYQKVYFGVDGDNSSFSRFTDCAPQFYDETNHKNTLFGSPNNDFTVDTSEGYPIDLNFEGLPLGCKILTSEQKEYLEYKFQEIEKINNKFLEAKDNKEKARISDTLRSLYEELHEWRKKATTVNVEGTAPGEEDN